MALEFIKLTKGSSAVSQAGGFGFFKLGVESSGGGTGDQATVIYGVKIDLANSNPETSVTYTDDAVGFNKSYMDFTNSKFEYGSWSDKFPFNQVKPCIVSGGKVSTYLNPNNYNEDIDGNAVNIKSNVDVMIEIPKIYYYMHNDDNYQYLQISNTKVNDNYCCLAHTLNGIENDKVYVGVYYSNTSGYSRSSYTSGSTSYRTYRTSNYSATPSIWHSNSYITGKKFIPITYHMINLLRLLFVLQFKSLNCTSALGKGYDVYTVSGDSYHEIHGTLNEKGMYWGSRTTSTNNNTGVSTKNKFMGMEDMWGNYNSVIYGLNRTDTGYNILDVTQTTSTWDSFEYSLTSGYLSQIYGTNELGFMPKATSGSLSTYYCTSTATTIQYDYYPMFSGMDDTSTIFQLSACKQNSVTGGGTGCRTMYYPQS